jgi:hypothetical protein
MNTDSHTNDDHGLPTTPTNHDDHGTPDWLKESESSFGGEDVLAKEIKTAPVDSHANSTPNWVEQDTPTSVSAPANIPGSNTNTISPAAETEHHDVPDWLKGADSPAEIQVSTEKTETVSPVLETPTVTQAPAEVHDIPDWLKGADEPTAETVIAPAAEATINTSEVMPSISSLPSVTTGETHDIPDWLKGSETSTETNITPETVEEIMPVVEIPNTETATAPEAPVEVHDIPDWLKGADEPTAETVTTPEVSSTTSTESSSISPFETPEKPEESLINNEDMVDNVDEKISEEQPAPQSEEKAIEET